MPRTRYLKHDYFLDELLAELPYRTRLLFAGLWVLADREGRLEDRPKKIKAQLFPYEPFPVDEELWRLVPHFILRYTVLLRDFIEIVNFSKHQKPHPREAESKIPAFSKEYIRSREKARPGMSKVDYNGDGDGDGEGGTLPPPPGPAASVDKPVDTVDNIEAISLCEQLRVHVLTNDINAKIPCAIGEFHLPAGRRWYEAAERLMRIDKRPYIEIVSVMKWALNDEFWKPNVLSMPKLRQKFPALRGQYLRKTGKKLGPWCEVCGGGGAAGKPALCGGCRHCKLCGQDQKPLKIGRRPDSTKVAVCRDCRAGLAPPPPTQDEHETSSKPRPGKVDAQAVLKGLGGKE